ncbi:MAG: hypothetical protein AAF436_12715 [Myxococcota bacterium]
MRRTALLALLGVLLVGCGDGSGGASVAGPIVDNLDWVPTDAGEEFFGAPPPGATCPPEPEGDCPTSDDDCVVIPPGGTCVTSYVAECLDQFTVLAVYTQRPDGNPLCNWVTLEQPSLRPIRAGDEIEVRAFHFPLNAPFGGTARIAFVVGDVLAVEESVQIPQPFNFINASWVATKDFPEGTPILFHVDNHGNNEYGLVEANICDERPVGDTDTPCFL